MATRLTRLLGGRACSLLPTMALAIGAAGVAVPAVLPPPSGTPALAPDVIKIEAVLSSKTPELGLSLRHRVASAIVEESAKAGFDPLLILGLIQVESSFDQEAVSLKGARGLMQLQPATLDYLAGLEGLKLSAADLYRDPALQVRLGVRYLARLERRFGSLDRALMAYNAGPGKLELALQDGEPDRYGSYVRAVRREFGRLRRGMAIDQDSALAQVLDRSAPVDPFAQAAREATP